MKHQKPASKTTCLVNPRAANNKWERNGKLRRDLENKFPGRIRHLMGDRKNTVELAKKACDESEMIVAIGGDGTVADVLQGIYEAKKENEVAFGVIPFGSGNAFRKSLGIPKNPAKAVDVLTRGKIVKADIMEVEGRYAGFASVGAMAGVTREKLRNPVYGLLGHLLATWKIFQHPRDEKTIELVDGMDDKGRRFERKTITSNFFECVVCKTNFFGYSWRIAPRARIADGYLDITFFEFGPITFLAAFPMIYLGLFQRTQRHFKARRITIHGKSLPVQYNGEVLGELDTVTFRVLPASLRVVVNK